MTPERLASMPRFAISLDFETDLIQPGLLAPPLVLGSAAEYNQQYDVYQDALQTGRPEAATLKCEKFSGMLLSKTTARQIFRSILDDPRLVVCVANGPYDFLVGAVDAAQHAGEDLMPQIFAMYDPHGTIIRGYCDGRVFDVQRAEELHAIAQGHLGKSARNNKQLGKSGRYSLDTVTNEVTGREDAKVNDKFRLDYALFHDVPLEQLPFEAQKYPVDDAVNTVEDALAQAGHLPSANPHQWVPHHQVGVMWCQQCNAFMTIDAPVDCMVRKPRRNLNDLSRQCYAAWALHLSDAWGFNIDQDAVDALEKKILDKRKDEAAPFVAAGIIRDDGTENQNVLKRLVAIAYGARHTCQVCAGSGKVPSPTTGGRTQINCKECDGCGLFLPPEVPRSDGGGIGKGRDVLQESADDLLTSYGEQEGKKIISTYIPLMRGGRACNVCGSKGVETKYTKAHKEWCTAQEGRAGYYKIPLNLRSNTLVETGRCSYGDGVHGLPRKGGVRECFVARPGYVFSSEDFTAGELVTHAQNCLEMVGYSRLADALNGGLDAHLALAGTMLGKSIDVMKALKKAGDPVASDNRQAAKGANFGFPGGMAELTFVLRKRADPDLFTPCPNGPDEDAKGNRGYKGMRPCILMDGLDRCGYVKVTEYNNEKCPPVCLKCVEAAKRLREFWFEQWPENNRKDGYFAIIKKLVGQIGPSGTAEIVHPGSNRIRGGVGFCDGANGLFQGRLADAAKNAYCQIQRECYDKTWRVRSSEMMTSAYADGPSPLLGSRGIMLAHDEFIGEHPESVAHDAATRASEIMEESLAFTCPRMRKAVSAKPTLMRRLYKGAEETRDANGRLICWEPKAA